MAKLFAERHALISGGTSGIGRAIALALTGEGCRVTVTGLTQAEVDSFDSQEHSIAAGRLDVTDPAGIQRVVSSIDRLDILINCAGAIRRGGAEHDPVEFANVVDVNLNGAMRMCVACKERLAVRGGCVLNMASMLSFFGSPIVPAYSASKGGVAQLTKSLAIAWAGDGIRVNAIAPGWIETPLTAPLVADEARSQELIQRTPMRRWGQPQDVAGAALFLCSPAAAFVTGVVLPVDGGYSIA